MEIQTTDGPSEDSNLPENRRLSSEWKKNRNMNVVLFEKLGNTVRVLRAIMYFVDKYRTGKSISANVLSQIYNFDAKKQYGIGGHALPKSNFQTTDNFQSGQPGDDGSGDSTGNVAANDDSKTKNSANFRRKSVQSCIEEEFWLTPDVTNLLDIRKDQGEILLSPKYYDVQEELEALGSRRWSPSDRSHVGFLVSFRSELREECQEKLRSVLNKKDYGDILKAAQDLPEFRNASTEQKHRRFLPTHIKVDMLDAALKRGLITEIPMSISLELQKKFAGVPELEGFRQVVKFCRQLRQGLSESDRTQSEESSTDHNDCDNDRRGAPKKAG